ncbi:Protein KES1 [Hypsizygus marmoreus]|uniref:Protein KES1 n=1 Tax=Hypsizygus marmoreus TaxID=39966 RepID=A0A369JIX7_HYPMA|nr:Protein KES1 [Hypsizygus marmoreus]
MKAWDPKRSGHQFSSCNVATHLIRNRPLNPVLGEYVPFPSPLSSILFSAPSHNPDYSMANGRNLHILFFPRHHHPPRRASLPPPPITAYVIENKTKGLRLIGHSAQKTNFIAGSIIVKQIGHAILTVSLPNNTKVEYLITLPRLASTGSVALLFSPPHI